MSDLFLSGYHALPPSLRSVVASVRGAYLRSWRYSSATDQLRDDALTRDFWSPTEWMSWRQERLAFVLHRAATRVPYYRDRWNERRRRGDRAAWDLLENWPVLEKETFRQRAASFIADDRRTSRMFHDHTSGTTGKPLDIWMSRQTVREWYALFEARCHRWYGVSRFDRWAIIGGQLIVPARQNTPPFWVWNSSLRQLYLSAYHLAAGHAMSYVNAMRRYQVRYLLGYPSAMHALAREIIRQGLKAPHLQVVVTNAEPLLNQQRSEISEAFGCPVREAYGMAEIVTAASECEEGRLHLWPDAGELEVLQRIGAPIEEAGEFICTGFLNADMPLIRYRVGDRGRLAPPESKCPCGRTLPILDAIEGRADDALYTSDGRVIGRLDPVFKSRLKIQEAQIVQDALDSIRVRYVPSEGFGPADEQSLISRVRDRMGAVNVTLERVDSIPRTANGKFRAVICNLSMTELERIRTPR